jgi:outer membrane protein
MVKFAPMNGNPETCHPSIRLRRWLLVPFLAVLVSPAFADLKVGYVNAVRVIEEAPQGVAALKKLQIEFGQRDKELVGLQDRIRQIDEELQKNVPVLKEADRRTREREILTLKRELKRATQEFREDYNQRRNEELAVLQQVVRKAILEIAKQEKYDLVLHEGTVYASDSIDITEKVLKKLGKQ